jgi:hypothetical protein
MKHARGRCECEKPGTVRSGVPGIIAAGPDRYGRRYVERCDLCLRFESDAAAGLEYARTMGGGSAYDHDKRTLWSPE